MLRFSTLSHCFSLYFWGLFILPFPYLCLCQVAALWLPSHRARDGLFALQSPAQHHLPLFSNLVFCLMSHKVKAISFLLFFLPLPPDVYFCVEFYCFPGLCSPAQGVLYIKTAPRHRVTWKKQRQSLALPLLPGWLQTPLKRAGYAFFSSSLQ